MHPKNKQGYYNGMVDDVAKRYETINGLVDAEEKILNTRQRFIQLGELHRRRPLKMPDSGPALLD